MSFSNYSKPTHLTQSQSLRATPRRRKIDPYIAYGVPVVESIAERECSRSRAALRLMTDQDHDSVAWPHHACVPLPKRRQHHLARSTLCGCIQRALLATRRRHGVQVREQLCRHALHARADGLDAADHLLYVKAQSLCTRVCDRVLRGGATPHTEKRCGSELEL